MIIIEENRYSNPSSNPERASVHFTKQDQLHRRSFVTSCPVRRLGKYMHTYRGVLSVTAIVAGNEIGDLSSTPGQGSLILRDNAFRKGMNPSVQHEAMSK